MFMNDNAILCGVSSTNGGYKNTDVLFVVHQVRKRTEFIDNWSLEAVYLLACRSIFVSENIVS